MKEKQEQLFKLLKSNHSHEAIEYALSLLKELTIPEIYEDILAPMLERKIDNNNIWHEHLISKNIISVIEHLSYKIKPTSSGLKIIIACPEEEGHEIGARMYHDFFRIEGFDSYFIGANTPTSEIIKAINTIKPNYIALSVSNYFNLTELKDIICAIKNNRITPKIIIGGSALRNNSEYLKALNYDFYLEKYSQIKDIKGGK